MRNRGGEGHGRVQKVGYSRNRGRNTRRVQVRVGEEREVRDMEECRR